MINDFRIYECLPSENINDPRAGFASAADGYNAFCNSKDATKPYCDTTLKKCYGCSITNNDPSGSGNPNALDCWINPLDSVTIGKCTLVPGATKGGSCSFASSCTYNTDCSTSCCSFESIPNTGNPGPGKDIPDPVGKKCIAPSSVNNPITPYLCRS